MSLGAISHTSTAALEDAALANQTLTCAVLLQFCHVVRCLYTRLGTLTYAQLRSTGEFLATDPAAWGNLWPGPKGRKTRKKENLPSFSRCKL